MVALSLVSSISRAQITGSEVPRDRVLPIQEDLEAQMKSSRFSFGPVYLIPRFEIANAGYISNIFGNSPVEKSDYTATASLGTDWLMRLGPKVYLRGNGLPSYIWYARTPEARQFGWTWNNALVLLFNRLTVQLSGDSSKTSSILNSETDERVLEKQIAGSASLEFRLTGHILLVGGAEAQQFRFQDNPPEPAAVVPDPTRLDRTELGARAGIRYRYSDYFWIDTQYDQTRATFTNTSNLGDSETDGYLLGVGLDGPEYVVHVSAGYRAGKPYNGSLFPSYRTGTGSAALSLQVRPRLGFQFYGHRDTQYSLYAPYYFENVAGGGIFVGIGERFAFHTTTEYGINDYPAFPGSASRRDHFTTYGGGLNLELARFASFRADATETRYHSDIPGFSRNILQVTGGLNLHLDNGLAVKAGTP